MTQWMQSQYLVAHKRRTFVVTHAWDNTFSCSCAKPRCSHADAVRERVAPRPRQLPMFTARVGRRFR